MVNILLFDEIEIMSNDACSTVDNAKPHGIKLYNELRRIYNSLTVKQIQ